jgi:aspartate racemase
LNPGNLAYNSQVALRFSGPLDAAALEHGLNEIVRRHEIYRTTFPVFNGRPVELIHQPKPVHLPVVDLEALPTSLHEAEARRLTGEELRTPFDLAELPLVRWTLLRLSADEHLLIHVEHHLVHDGWSVHVFLTELMELYKAFSAGGPSPLPELPVQFADYAYWQRQWMQGEEAEEQLAYWTTKLAAAPPILELPADRPRPALQSFRGAQQKIEISSSFWESLGARSRREGTTLFMTMLTAFVALLYRYTGQDDICVGSGIANRRSRQTEGLIGMIVNNLVLRTDLSGDPTFRELLGRVRKVAMEAYAHQDLPFDKVVEALRPKRDLSHNPLFQVMFNFQDTPLQDLEFPGLTVSLLRPISNGSAKFDLNVVVYPPSEQRAWSRSKAAPESTIVMWEYSTDLFDDTTIVRMMEHYEILLKGIVADPEQSISRVALLTDAERNQILLEWNDTRRDYLRDSCVHEIFEAQTERSPEATAVVFGDERLTYRELNTRANRLAHYLRKLGASSDRIVGVCMERSFEMLVAVLGILKAGGAYLPLDPGYPRERLEFMLKDSGTTLLLTQSNLLEQMPWDSIQNPKTLLSTVGGSQIENLGLLCLDTEWKTIAQESAENPQNEATAENLAYVMYTSGSTGMPKGVAISHRGISRLVLGVEYVTLDAKQAFLQLAPISFDGSTFEIWGALLHGAKCVLSPGNLISPGELGEIVDKHNISTLWLTASLFNTVIDQAPEALAGVRQLLIGGEPVSVPHVRKALSLLPQTQIINGYGPTESTTFTCCYSIPRDLADAIGSIPIGRPISNTEVYLLDRHLQAVPIGVPGEVYIGGDGLAGGYLNRPELTAEKFIPHPFAPEPGARLYRTGDLARYLPDGVIEFLGRTDNQVKIRGYRIEPEEIETVLRGHPQVSETVVLARMDAGGDKRLVGYVVTNAPVAMSGLRNFLAQKLPDYMVPSAFVFLDALPLTPNGKIDRKALPDPEPQRPASGSAFAAPRTPAERLVANAWTEVLKLDKVGVHDNFFELGGHSLLAIRVISRVRDVFSVDVSLRSLFEYPTIAGLVEHIETLLWAGNNQQPAHGAASEDRDEINL